VTTPDQLQLIVAFTTVLMLYINYQLDALIIIYS